MLFAFGHARLVPARHMSGDFRKPTNYGRVSNPSSARLTDGWGKFPRPALLGGENSPESAVAGSRKVGQARLPRRRKLTADPSSRSRGRRDACPTSGRKTADAALEPRSGAQFGSHRFRPPSVTG